MLLTLFTLQLSAQDYEYKYEAVLLDNQEMVVHSRWNSIDYSCNKNSFKIRVPVNTVAIVYAYRSWLTEVSVPEIKLLAGVTKCIGSIASLGNKGLGKGVDMIANGIKEMSIPSGTADVDIYLFNDKKWIYELRETPTSDCQQKFYDPEYDLLSQKSGKKTIKLKQVEKSFDIYLGLVNNDLNDAITVRIEAVAIKATKVPIAKPVETPSASKIAEIPPTQDESSNVGIIVFILIAVAVAAGVVVLMKKKQSQPVPTPTKKIEETEEQKKIREMQKKIEAKIVDANNLNVKIKNDIEEIKKDANTAIVDLYGKYVEIPSTELFSHYSFVLDKYGDKVDETPKMQCDRNVKDAQNAIHSKLELIGKNNKVISKGKELVGKLNKQYEVQSQIEKQKKHSQKINASATNTESDTANQIYGTEIMNQINDEYALFEKEIEELRNLEIEVGSIKI